ncbi:MAG: branched-chain amino acid transaminase [Anaerolineales bacterium]
MLKKHIERPVFHNGVIIPYDEARIHVMSPALKYGAAVYEGIRAYWNEEKGQLYVFRPKDHARRLMNSIKLMCMQTEFSLESLCQAVLNTLRASQFHQDLHIRQCVFVDGAGGIGATDPVGISIVPVPTGRSLNQDGIHMGVSSWTRIHDNSMPARIKCVANYQNGRLAQLQATLDGYDVPLLLDNRGKVAEAPTATFFLVRNGTLITCPLTSGVLESITRETILQMARESSEFGAEVREIDRTELYLAEEAFLCGTAAEVTPVLSIDHRALGDGAAGDLTKKIRSAYLSIACGESEAHADWRTAVY